MAEFNIRSDAVDVEQIMEQIRARLREKRGVDYTEEQIRELATVKLDRFLDPRNVRSDLLEHFRKQSRTSDDAASATQAALEVVHVPTFEPDQVYRSSRGGIGRVLYAIRRMLRPILKLFINPNPLLEYVRAVSGHVNTTSRALALNEERNRRRAELDVLMYEVLNNLVVEMTRLAIDMKNHKMRVESVAARLDFDERRARALEQIVQFRTSAAAGDGTVASGGSTSPPTGNGGGDGVTEKRRRRRRGRRRRSGGSAPAAEASAEGAAGSEPADVPQSSGEAGSAAAPADVPQSSGEAGGAAASAEPPAAAPEPAGGDSEP